MFRGSRLGDGGFGIRPGVILFFRTGDDLSLGGFGDRRGFGVRFGGRRVMIRVVGGGFHRLRDGFFLGRTAGDRRHFNLDRGRFGGDGSVLAAGRFGGRLRLSRFVGRRRRADLRVRDGRRFGFKRMGRRFLGVQCFGVCFFDVRSFDVCFFDVRFFDVCFLGVFFLGGGPCGVCFLGWRRGGFGDGKAEAEGLGMEAGSFGDDLGDQLLGLPAGGAVADGDDADLVFADQVLEGSLASWRRFWGGCG